MYIDKSLEMANALAITTSVAETNTLDLAKCVLGIKQTYAVVVAESDFVFGDSSKTIKIDVVSIDIYGVEKILASKTATIDELKAGNFLIKTVIGENKRYIKTKFTYGSGITSVTGKLSAYLTQDVPVGYESDVQVQVVTPEIDTEAGTYISSKAVVVTSRTEGASIYYTTDGSTPDDSKSLATAGAITVSASCTLKFIAVKDGMLDSEVVSVVFVIQCATPTADPDGGNFETSQEIELACATAGVTIYYTDDNSTPTAGSTAYTTPFTITGTKTIKAIAIKANLVNSAILSKTFTKTN